MTSDPIRFADASRLEADLRHYRELFDGAPDGYVLTDAHGLIREGNRTLSVMLGVHPRFLDRKLLVSFVARGDVKRFRASLARLARGEGDMECVRISLRPRHGQAPFVAEIAPRVVRGPDGRVVSIRWGVRKEKHPPVEAEGRSGRELLALVIRDLRALVRTVQTAGGELGRELARGPLEALPLLEEIRRASERMLHLASAPFDPPPSPDGTSAGDDARSGADAGVAPDGAASTCPGTPVALLFQRAPTASAANEENGELHASQRFDDGASDDDPA